MAQTVAAQIKLQEALREGAANTLSALHDALVFVQYARSTLVQERVRSVGNLINYLDSLPPDFSGDHVVPRASPLSSVVHAVRVTRGSFVGPIFQVEGGAWISDPIVECIKRKLAKRYPVAHRLELLASYELQFTSMATMKIPEVEAFVESHLPESQFERVCVFDAENRFVLFSCDRSALKRGHAL